MNSKWLVVFGFISLFIFCLSAQIVLASDFYNHHIGSAADSGNIGFGTGDSVGPIQIGQGQFHFSQTGTLNSISLENLFREGNPTDSLIAVLSTGGSNPDNGTAVVAFSSPVIGNTLPTSWSPGISTLFTFQTPYQVNNTSTLPYYFLKIYRTGATSTTDYYVIRQSFYDEYIFPDCIYFIHEGLSWQNTCSSGSQDLGFIGNGVAGPPLSAVPSISSLVQYKSDALTQIVEGGVTTEDAVVFSATLQSSSTNQLQLQAEYSSSTSFSGTANATSTFVAPGNQASVVATGLYDGQYRWRARAVDSQGNSSNWQEFGTAGNTDFIVHTVPLVTQIDLSWAGSSYANGRGNNPNDPGRCGPFIKNCGCAITSVVMILRYYNINVGVDSNNVDPFQFDAWLDNNNGYGEFGDLNWLKVEEYSKTSSNGFARIHYDGGFGVDTDRLNTYVGALKPAILKVQVPTAEDGLADHYIVATSKLVTTYTVRDPLLFNTKTLNDSTNDFTNHVRSYGNQFAGLRLYSALSGPVDGISFNIASPAQLVVIDPSGKRLGVDPVSNISYSEIADGSYFTDGISDVSVANPTSSHEVKTAYIPHPVSGNYQIQVIGTDSGNYVLSSLAYDASSTPHAQVFSGSTQTNLVTDFNLVFTPADPQDIAIKPVDKILPEAEIFFDPGTKQLDVIGTDNITQPAPIVEKQNNVYLITDAAGNTLKLGFEKLKQEGKEIKAELRNLQYNEERIVKLPEVELKFEWSLDKHSQQIKELKQKIEVKDQFEVKAKYNRERNETVIKIEKGKGRNKQETKQTFSGLTLIKLVTKSGVLDFEF